MKKKVYTEEGEYVGNINGIILGDNRVDSLKIKLYKRKNVKMKGITIRYKNVKSFGDIVIVEDMIGINKKGNVHKKKVGVKSLNYFKLTINYFHKIQINLKT